MRQLLDVWGETRDVAKREVAILRAQASVGATGAAAALGAEVGWHVCL